MAECMGAYGGTTPPGAAASTVASTELCSSVGADGGVFYISGACLATARLGVNLVLGLSPCRPGLAATASQQSEFGATTVYMGDQVRSVVSSASSARLFTSC